jgi:uncharacterized protein YndB with AHSA1/START domain
MTEAAHLPQFHTSRQIPAAVESVFAAFCDPDRLSRWWGPSGFTNSFKVCDFKTGGKWSYVMVGPDGKEYANESIFEEIVPPNRLVIKHVSKPEYRLVIALDPSREGTAITWSQTFENNKFASGMKQFLTRANEQNLDRLATEVSIGSR